MTQTLTLDSETAVSASSKKVFIQTFGCQMNERDSEGVKGLLLRDGFCLTEKIEDAEVILFNTCSVRQHAEDRVFGRAGILAKLKQRNPKTVIGILGCMAQEHGSRFFRRLPALDLVCGPGNLSQIPELLRRVATRREKIVAIDRINDLDANIDELGYRTHEIRASVNIMSGCDHKCTYCIVPMTRGVERSRPAGDILEEVRGLVGRGFRDLMLLGQNVNGYGKKLEPQADFTDLLRQIDRIAAPAKARMRFTTSHPKDAHARLFDAMRDLESVCEHLHLPVQSGSDRILRRMKREHTRDWYLERIAEYRERVPNGSLTTDLITGFCGETEEDFGETVRLMNEVEFDSAYIFKYSERPGTPASRLPDDVPEAVKQRRHQELLELQRAASFARNSRLIGAEAEALVEEEEETGVGFKAFGRTRTFKRVVLRSAVSLKQKFVTARITEVLHETLLGERVGESH